MGCGSSKKTATKVSPMRRGLTLGDLGDEGDEVEIAEDGERCLLMQVTQQQVLDLITNCGKSRRFSLGSQTDEDGNLVTGFGSKATKLEGETVFDSSTENIGFACKKGLKPEAPNQDSFLIVKVEDSYALYGVFDGHGRYGHDVSNFVKENLPKILLTEEKFTEDPQNCLLRSFQRMQHLIVKATALKTIDASRSGTTCSLVLHRIPEKVLYVAHVGDSRVVLGKRISKDPQSKWEAINLTIDHKPDLPEERDRIEKNGGVVIYDGVWNYRVYAKDKTDARGRRYPGLNMSRAMGDLCGFDDAGISCTPDVREHPVGEKRIDKPHEVPDETYESSCSTPSISSYDIDSTCDMFILLCSDGVWEFISSQEAVSEVASYPSNQSMNAAEHLATKAWDAWMHHMEGQVVDDITCLIAHVS